VNITIGFKPLKPVLQSANYKYEELHRLKKLFSMYTIFVFGKFYH